MPRGAGGVRELGAPPFDLDEPGTIPFTARRALRGQALNRFALSLRSPVNREKFLEDQRGYVGSFGVGVAEIDMIEQRDWTGLLQMGGHLQALLKVAAALGQDLWDIGADNVGVDRGTLMSACPRWVAAVPEGA